MHHFEVVRDVLAIKTNILDFSWSFGSSMPNVEEDVYKDCKIKLEVRLGDFDHPKTTEGMSTYHFFSHLPEENGILYVRDFILGKQLKWKLIDVNTRNPKMYINKSYYKYIKYRFMNIHSAQNLLVDLTTFLLLREGLAPVYASSFQWQGQTSTVFAPPNTGKTLTCMKACTEEGAMYVAEDMAVTDGEKVFAMPWTCSYRSDRTSHFLWKDRIRRFLPVFELFQEKKPPVVQELVKENRVLHVTKNHHLVILEKSLKTSVREECREKVLKKVENLNSYGLYYVKSPLLMAYTYFYPEFTLGEAVQVEKEILRRLVDNAEKTLVVADRDASNFLTLIQGEISNAKQRRTS